MSTISSSLAPRTEAFSGAFFRRVGRTLKGWWIAYINWRVERMAAARLHAMSDRELKDIGVPRATIEFAVKGHAESHPTFTVYY